MKLHVIGQPNVGVPRAQIFFRKSAWQPAAMRKNEDLKSLNGQIAGLSLACRQSKMPNGQWLTCVDTLIGGRFASTDCQVTDQKIPCPVLTPVTP